MKTTTNQIPTFRISSENTTDSDLTCTIFGSFIYSKANGVKNGNNPETVVIDATMSEMTCATEPPETYNDFLKRFETPKKFSLIRIVSSNEKQVAETIRIIHANANGVPTNDSMSPSTENIEKSGDNFTIDIIKDLEIGGNTYLQFTLLAGASVDLCFYDTLQ